MRLDIGDRFPSGMQEYLSYYGWHFNKHMYEYAISHMYKRVSNRKEYIEPYTKEYIDTILTNYNINFKEYNVYDYMYIANMVKADFYGSAIQNEEQLAYYIRDVMEDSDAYEGMIFTRYYADCIGKGLSINWDDML